MATKASPKAKAKTAKVVQSIDEINAEIATKQADLLEQRRGLRIGELTNPRVIGATRKEIARLMTAARSQELAKGDN